MNIAAKGRSWSAAIRERRSVIVVKISIVEIIIKVNHVIVACLNIINIRVI